MLFRFNLTIPHLTIFYFTLLHTNLLPLTLLGQHHFNHTLLPVGS